MWIRILITLGLLAVLAMEPLAAPTRVPGRLFMQDREAEGVDVTLARFNDRRLRVFDRQIAYRDERKACVRFELPAELPWPGAPLRVELEAYNDDRKYLRTIWFEVDGIGGYLAVQRVAAGQYRGSGTVGPGQHKRWVLPLDCLPISLEGERTTSLDLDMVLRQPGTHTICAWISTYARYGPKSWITLDVVGSPAPNHSGQDTTDEPAFSEIGFKDSPGRTARVEPCAGRTRSLPNRSLRLTLLRHPDPRGNFDEPVCGVLEVRKTRNGEPVELLQRFDLIAGESRTPRFYLDYVFADYLPQTGVVVLKQSKALRLYDVKSHRLSELFRPPECIGEDGRSYTIEWLQALDQDRFLYGEAVSCHPFLICSDRPEKRFFYLEAAGTYTLFRDEGGRLLAAETESSALYRFPARAGRNARFALTYFLNERGMNAYRKKDYTQAVKWFDRAAEVTPEDYLYPYTNLAGSLALAGMTDEALAQLRRACSLDRSFTRERMSRDPDFADLRNSSQFHEILQSVCAEN